MTAHLFVPATAAPGDGSFSVVVMGANGGNATLDIAFTVVEGNAEPAPSSSSVATGNETGQPQENVDEGGVPSPGLPLVVASLLATVFLLRRRRLA